ncbi:sugar (and other) transporter family protein [Latilactobacillus sakei subsp. carnosus DSM 15831]|uniref:MFS transporter n=1 Tax=Latilactobacillus sakei TaxID=1599 RepID=UPI0006EFEE51|nr:MFS transporter [Latilactobacillus sakei]KRL70250.1 sugar (and other) transporter family protein [Latilactobacillus sakei subsp. carnosus DSM 15831]GEP20887.1 MFS transporter [Latilactobacillus sakei subsp. carnosus]
MTKEQHKLLWAAGGAWLFDAMDVGLLSFVIAALAKEWHLNSGQMGLIGSVGSIGMAIGAVFFGALADKIGRRNSLLFSLLLFSIGNGLSALSPSLIVFMALRLLVGIGLGGELPVASTLISENTPDATRGRAVVLLESFWAAGWLAASLLAYFVIPNWGWRVVLLITSLPAIYTLVLREHVKDSHEPATIQKPLPFRQRVTKLWQPAYRQKTALLWFVWFLVVFSYYGMFLWLPSVMVLKGFSLVNSFGYVLIMTLAQLPGYFFAAWLIEKWGRKWVLGSFLIGTVISAYFFGTAQSVGLLISAGALLSFFNLGAWGALYAYTPEQYPAIIRGSGSGLAAAVGRIGGIVGPFLVGYLINQKVSITVIFTIFTVAILMAAGAVLLFGVETMHQKMTDVD